VNYYELLGIEPSASTADIRRAYVARARRHHPDLEADPARRRDAERRMQRLNEAWSVLSQSDRRAAYDRRIGLPPPGHVPRRPWVPVEPDDFDEVDPRDLLDDTPIGDGAHMPRVLQLAPPLLVVGAVLGVLIGAVTAIPGVLALGLVAGLLGIMLFLFAPFFAVLRSARSGSSPKDGDG
jgi:DnaJ domain